MTILPGKGNWYHQLHSLRDLRIQLRRLRARTVTQVSLFGRNVFGQNRILAGQMPRNSEMSGQ
jgi:hypothetical protein